MRRKPRQLFGSQGLSALRLVSGSEREFPPSGRMGSRLVYLGDALCLTILLCIPSARNPNFVIRGSYLYLPSNLVFHEVTTRNE